MKITILLIVVLSAFVSAAGQARSVAIEVAPEGRRGPRDTETNRDRVVRPVSAERVRASFGEEYAIERRTFDLINAERLARGLTPLRWSSDLSILAKNHSESMADGNFFSHKGRDGSFVDDRAESLGLNTWASIGENIAFIRGYEKPAETAIEKWMQSPAHRNNLLSNRWREAAIGVAIASNGTLYFTQVFILRN